MKTHGVEAVNKRWKIIVTTARIALAGLLFWWVLGQVHWLDFAAADAAGRPAVRAGMYTLIRGVDGWRLGAAALCALGSVLLAGLRWRVLLAVQQVRLSVRDALKLTLVGEAFNAVMPGIIGGDVAKGYYVARGRPGKSRIATSLVASRLIGLCGCTLWAAMALVLAFMTNRMDASTLRVPAISVALIAAGGLAAATVLAVARSPRLAKLRALGSRLPLARHAFAAGDAFAEYGRHPTAMLHASLLTVGCQALAILSVALIGQGLHLPLPWANYFVVVPLILILSAVPLTPGSAGVTEKLYVVYLAGAADPGAALALALLARVIALVPALPGAVLYGLGTRLPLADSMRRGGPSGGVR